MAILCLVTALECKVLLVQFAQALITSERQDGWIFVVIESNDELSLRLNQLLRKQLKAGNLRRHRAHYDVILM